MSLMSTNGSRRTSGINCGFTLIEVLISLTLLAVGMLGMTALQTESLKFNNAALTDSQAQFLLQDMVERIRANKSSNSYVMSYTDELDSVVVDCAAADCDDPGEIAIWDMTQWRDLVADTLPQGESQILFNTLNRNYVISVRYEWSQLGGEDITGGKRTVSITTRI
jgi:type IV pilus assembly protein PilV